MRTYVFPRCVRVVLANLFRVGIALYPWLVFPKENELIIFLFVAVCIVNRAEIPLKKNLSMKLLCFAAYFVSFTSVLSPLSFRHANAQVALLAQKKDKNTLE